jgi:hypothetical protein
MMFVAGIAFVLACGSDGKPDAGTSADAQVSTCTGCEPRITLDRVYRATAFAMEKSSDVVTFVGVSCAAGDVLLSGGCYILEPGHDGGSVTGDHFLLASGPARSLNDQDQVTSNSQQGWSCRYSNPQLQSVYKVEADAICLKVAK